MNEIVFAPDSGTAVLLVMGLIAVGFGVFGSAILVRKQIAGDNVELGAWAGALFFVGLGAFLVIFPCMDAKSVAIVGDSVVLTYPWPRGERALDVHDIKDARLDMRGTTKPSPYLVIELRDGNTLTGEGTRDRTAVENAVLALKRAVARGRRD